MNFEEYELKVNALKETHKKELYAIYKEYALSNSPVKKGDIISGTGGGSILVDSVKWTKFSYRQDSPPEAVYDGIKYTKSGKPFKSGDRDRIYQSNLKSINGEFFK